MDDPDEPRQELSMIHLDVGVWVLGIDLVLGKDATKNPLGIVHITGDENLYHLVDEKEDEHGH